MRVSSFSPPPPRSTPKVLPALGGSLAGSGAGLVSGAAILGATAGLEQVVQASLPAASSLPSGWKVALAVSGVAALAGAGMGAQIAAGAAQEQNRPDPFAPSSSGSQRQLHSAELRQNLGWVSQAQDWKSAAAAGFRAGASLGGPAGAAAGKIQGACLGAALGGAVSLPLVQWVPSPLVLLPGALAGGALGLSLGESLGYSAGALALGGLGGAAAATHQAVRGVLGGAHSPP